MTFNDRLTKYKSLLNEQEPAPQDAAAPAPQAEQPSALPAKAAPMAVPPEGYVDMVRLLAKALVMNVPAGSIDTLFTKPITQENAIEMREQIENAISTNESAGDNEIRIANPNVQKFVDSTNENNFMAKYKQILAMMKNYSNDPSLS
jgi:hypothetical protein